MGKFSNWSKEEDEILMKVLKSTKSKKWIKTSQKLKEHNFIRTPSQCRQRFINYLAPEIDKTQITQEELETIYEKYEQFGPKWSLIQQFVIHKTQCKIKNVFYGNIKNLLKTTYKFFTFKTASFINTISTQHLQIVYDGSADFDSFCEVREGIRAMNYRNNKCDLIKYIMTKKDRFLLLINNVLKQIFNMAPINCVFDQKHQRKIAKLLKIQKLTDYCQKNSIQNTASIKKEDNGISRYLQDDNQCSESNIQQIEQQQLQQSIKIDVKQQFLDLNPEEKVNKPEQENYPLNSLPKYSYPGYYYYPMELFYYQNGLNFY